MIVEFFPESSRCAKDRLELARQIMEGHAVSTSYMEFGYDYFDNPIHGIGYGGYQYDGRYAEVARRMADHYGLEPGDHVLEIGCAKGYLMVEFQKIGMEVVGIDVSKYAVGQAHADVKACIMNTDAEEIPFPNGYFQLVIGKEVLPHVPVHNLEATVRECIRVSCGKLFFEIQCGHTEKELAYMAAWDKTHHIIKSPGWWDSFFANVQYPGDVHYKVLIPEGETV